MHVGGAGAGQVVKACNQIVVAVTIEAVSRGARARLQGRRRSRSRSSTSSAAGSPPTASWRCAGSNFLEHDFTPGFRVDLHHKDLNIALESGDAFGVPLPATSLVQQHLRALRAKGHGGDDHSALLTVVEELRRASASATETRRVPCPA